MTESGRILEEGLFERGAYLKIHALKGGLFERRAYVKGGLIREAGLCERGAYSRGGLIELLRYEAHIPKLHSNTFSEFAYLMSKPYDLKWQIY